MQSYSGILHHIKTWGHVLKMILTCISESNKSFIFLKHSNMKQLPNST